MSNAGYVGIAATSSDSVAPGAWTLKEAGLAQKNGTWPQEFSYWRLYITATQDNVYAEIAELEMRETAGGADQCSGGTATSSVDLGSPYTPGAAIDNDVNTFWVGLTVPAWWQYQFSLPKKIVQLSITARSVTYHYLKDFSLQKSVNGTDWITVQSWTGQSFTGGETKLFNV